MRLRLSPRASRDISDIGRYIRAHDPAAALKVRDAIQTGLQTLADYPQSGRKLARDLYRFTLPRYPYLIYYRLDDVNRTVLIVTIRHAARREEDSH